jgi:hypothetical protein
MKKHLLLLLVACLSVPLVRAGQLAPDIAISEVDQAERVPIDYVETESAYVFESDLNHGGSFGDQDELQSEIEYGHRIHLSGHWYFHLGLSYNRFDFGNTAAPVPVHLQSAAAVIGIDYMKGEDTGAFIQFRPGFYTEEHLGISSFDCPITTARFWILRDKKLYLLTGATGSFLRGNYPVIPLVGVVWVVSPQLKVMAIPPEPKIIYSPNGNLDMWVGGEFAGGSFRTDNDFQGVRNKRLSGAVVDFADYRAGVGVTYSVNDNLTLDFSGGCSLQRQFDFSRADETYRTDPSPYVRLEVKAKF